MRIILATKSERRKILFKKIIENFEVIESNFEEKSIKEKDPVKFAVECAIGKAKSVGEKYPESIVVGADTVVYVNDEIIGKPENYEEAKIILKKLSGTRHKVITGIAIYQKEKEKLLVDYEVSFVKFKELKDQEIEDYLKTGDFFDKAGAYGIQNIGDKFVEEIEGDFDNVVGLPIQKTKDLLDRFFSEIISVDIEDIAFPNNWAVARYNNLVIFVPGGIVGDRVKVKLSKGLKNYAFGEIVEIEKSSEFRVKPLCEHFNFCGGCVFQNLLYEKQIELKKNYFIQTLKKIGNFDEKFNIEEIIPSPEIYFYRNKMEFAFGSYNNKIVLGLRERRYPYKRYRKNVVPLKKCYIFSESVEKIFPCVLNFLNNLNLEPYDPFEKKGILRHLVIRESKNKNEIMIILVTKSISKNIDFVGLIDLLLSEIKEIKSIYWVENNQLSDVVSYEKKHLIYGNPYIEEILGNLNFRIYPEIFFQPNTKVAEILYGKIKENVKEGSKIVGLFSGSGGIEIFLSDRVKEVIGVDWEEFNINTAVENCEINHIRNCKFYKDKSENFLNNIEDLKGVDYLIVDPPRGGLSKKCIKKILKVNFPFIIYVSCNPSTLARDLKEIREGGYILKKIFLFDMFPHTTHIESITILEKV
ncbi:MAG: 23S rRNA (uracil(1939)-C(5))-methyltransferase RlmD [Candidatus Omnitrophica bacterium]|nr:23S rRNA (uracil(1939)-C(5))-methyltransferase RlmD [Candidatus Omnitrophota bacterium]